jgi:hypothetical protein
VSLADADAALSRHVADIDQTQADFDRVWQRGMAAIDVKTERIWLCMDAIDSARHK